MQSMVAQAEAILRSDRLRWHLLGVVEKLDLPDCWIGAGFVRNAIWDHMHGFPVSPPDGDIDVIWFDRNQPDPEFDRQMEEKLKRVEPGFDWSVKNQARMHLRNGDEPYRSATDAMRYWPETATAIAARRLDQEIELSAPLGLDDLFDLKLRPTLRFESEKRSIFDERISSKHWLECWPKLSGA